MITRKIELHTMILISIQFEIIFHDKRKIDYNLSIDRPLNEFS